MLIDFIKKVWDWILAFFDAIRTIATWLMDAVVYVLLNIPFAIYKLVLAVIHGIVSVLSVGSLVTNVSVGWGLLPSQLGYLIGATGLDVGLSMLALAYGIRFLLNLIPGAVTRV